MGAARARSRVPGSVLVDFARGLGAATPASLDTAGLRAWSRTGPRGVRASEASRSVVLSPLRGHDPAIDATVLRPPLCGRVRGEQAPSPCPSASPHLDRDRLSDRISPSLITLKSPIPPRFPKPLKSPNGGSDTVGKTVSRRGDGVRRGTPGLG